MPTLLDYNRPATRADCLEGGINELRPCPWVSCRHHLALDVNDGGNGLTGSTSEDAADPTEAEGFRGGPAWDLGPEGFAEGTGEIACKRASDAYEKRVAERFGVGFWKRNETTDMTTTYTPLQDRLLEAIKKHHATKGRGPKWADLFEHVEGESDYARVKVLREALEPIKGKVVDWSNGPGGIRLVGRDGDAPAKKSAPKSPVIHVTVPKPGAPMFMPATPAPAPASLSNVVELLTARRLELEQELATVVQMLAAAGV